ncbi:hypothetical protein HDV00_006455 [Rhizophlyctis rosea]|nr:hypothetical protein HDV00_006455 [Rhizophlyctis rosea]
MVRNEVRGPSSALSSFLRERGIRAPRDIFHRRRGAGAAAGDDNQDGDQNGDNADTNGDTAANGASPDVDDADADTATAGPSRTGRRRRSAAPSRASSSTSDLQQAGSSTASPAATPAASGMDLDEAEPVLEEETATTSKKKPTRKAPTKPTSKKRKPTKKKGDYESDPPTSDSDFADAPIGRSNHSKRRKRTSDLIDAYNTIRFCERCQRRYTVGEDMSTFCPACLSIQSKASAGGLAKTKRKKGKIVATLDGTGATGVVSLKDMCVKLIAAYIDDVEAFGDISEQTKRQISCIISRDRQLGVGNVGLFLGPEEERVELFDCTYLDEGALNQIPYSCPNLRVLHLGQCGRITDEVLKSIGHHCPHLTSLTLKGPFLPTDLGFQTLFTSLGKKLTSLHLSHAAKLSHSAIEALVTSCPDLRVLRLDSCHRVGDEGVRALAKLKCLEELQLDSLGEGVKEESLMFLVESVGSGLGSLSFNGYPEMSDKVLLESIAPTCTSLRKLFLKDCPSLTTDGIIHFLAILRTPAGLTHFSLGRNVHLADSAIIALLNDHAHTLEHLSLNGLDELTEVSLGALKGCMKLRELDVSWIRDLDDFMLGDVLKGCKCLEEVRIYGCSKLNEEVLGRVWRNEGGREIRVVGNEFD